MEQWDAKQAALDVWSGKYDADLSRFLDALTNAQLTELLQETTQLSNAVKTRKQED